MFISGWTKRVLKTHPLWILRILRILKILREYWEDTENTERIQILNTEDTERILIILRILRGYWENWGYWENTENTENTEDTHPLHPAPFTRFHSQSDAPLYSKDNPPTLTIATSIYLTNCKQPPSGLGEGQAYLFRVGNSVTGVRGGGHNAVAGFPLNRLLAGQRLLHHVQKTWSWWANTPSKIRWNTVQTLI